MPRVLNGWLDFGGSLSEVPYKMHGKMLSEVHNENLIEQFRIII